jgi:purine-binding chemotaxis protein CheW
MMIATDDDGKHELLVSTFYIGEKIYGLPTTNVQEIVPLQGLTPVHHAPRFIRGVVNLRGKIVTVFDLAVRTGLGRLAEDTEGRVIVLHWSGEYIGLLVDEVIDVFPVQPVEIARTPANMPQAQAVYLLGVLSREAGLIPILDVDAVLADDVTWVEGSAGAKGGGVP